ncbi:hypothetical protein [Ectobacillus antri]|jgi:hypothetical protein|uniref:hypothetical protein n=1 Tax=Ectobacillus antri TaxID=2486280 RepID=UPI000F5ABB2D|nr:hypothetical protein [Ectobacillus antri]
MKQSILMVKIHGELEHRNNDLYETTRGFWKIDRKRVDYIEVVVGVLKGKIVCAYMPDSWQFYD